MPSLLAKNAALLVTMDEQRREIRAGGLFVRDGIIEQVGPTEQLPAAAHPVLDLSGQIVLPGLANTHHHLDQTLTRSPGYSRVSVGGAAREPRQPFTATYPVAYSGQSW